MQGFINVEDLISMEYFPRKKMHSYFYQKRKSFLGITTKKEGFYFQNYFNVEYIGKKIDIVNRFSYGHKVFSKPGVLINLKGREITKWFDRKSECFDFLNESQESIKNDELIILL